MLLIGIVGFNFVSAKENDLPLLGKIIYVDPGHPRFYKPSVVMSCSK